MSEEQAKNDEEFEQEETNTSNDDLSTSDEIEEQELEAVVDEPVVEKSAYYDPSISFEDQLVAFFKKNRKSKVRHAAKIAATFVGKEQEVMTYLYHKYVDENIPIPGRKKIQKSILSEETELDVTPKKSKKGLIIIIILVLLIVGGGAVYMFKDKLMGGEHEMHQEETPETNEHVEEEETVEEPITQGEQEITTEEQAELDSVEAILDAAH